MPQMFPSYMSVIYLIFIIVFYIFMNNIYWQMFSTSTLKKEESSMKDKIITKNYPW